VAVALTAFAGWAVSSSAQAALTIESFTAETASTLAGAHSDATTAFSLAGITAPNFGLEPKGGDPQEIVVKLPPGLVGNPQAATMCAKPAWDEEAAEPRSHCPADSQVGEGTAQVNTGFQGVAAFPIKVFDLAPGPGEPALFGLTVAGFNSGSALVHVAASAKDGYAVTARIPELPRTGALLGATLTFWGVPADHNGAAEKGEPRRPLMENATSCSSTPATTLMINTSEEPTRYATVTASSPVPADCADVPFAPSISLTPDTTLASAPAGFAVDLSVPQSNDPEGRGTSALKEAVVTLPEGMTISPSAASKELEGCTDAQFGAGSDTPASCPAASIIGVDEVHTPLLSGPLKGRVFLGAPLSTNPTSGEMFRVFQELQGFGLDIKLAGSVVADPQTGQLTATFSNLPQLPFQDFKLHFNGGPNAVLVNPPACGANTTTARLTPYSGTSPITRSSTFTTSYDGNGARCPSVLPFAPSSSISTTSSQAGAFSSLTASFSRGDRTQPLGQITAHLPPGLLGYVSAVPLCDPADAAAGTCPASSRVGVVSATAGAGSNPLTVPGAVYLAHGTGGYPFALSVVVPAIAGPYDLGDVVVLVNIQVNSDGSITGVSGPLPSILDGIPLDIRSVALTIDRPGFTFNPTNCDPLSMGGSITSLVGVIVPIAAPFQLSGCGSLPFAPSFAVATEGSTSKANGASLSVRIAQRPGETDIRSVHVELPIQLPSRLTTLQKACTDTQFASNPAGCPAGSDVGTATVITPTLSSPLTGPVFLVSHGGAAFPELEVVLQGEGVSVILEGATDIKRGVTSAMFASAPDVPISAFELTLPEGPNSLLAAVGTLCTSKLLIPTTIVGWNGLVIKQGTRIAVSGCPRIKIIAAKVKGAMAALTLEVPSAGRLTVSGPGLKQAEQTFKQAGNLTMHIGPSSAGLASLHRHHGKLKVKLTASYTPSAGPSFSVFTIVTFR
jgi:hypothetical protein